jgi:hypothetical protein
MASLEQIIDAILVRDGSQPTGKNLVIANHLSQMRLFGIRQGVEFFPAQDQGNVRKDFLDRLYTDNKIDLYLERVWDLFLCRGQILWYLRPTGDTYRIYYFDKTQFRAYYDADGDLSRVVVVYSYAVESDIQTIDNKRWVRMEITKDKIIQSESTSKPGFTSQAAAMPIDTKSIDNTLGFIPCVVSSNYLTQAGQSGHGEFDWLRDQIESHEDDLINLRKNLKFFGNPTLVTSRAASEVTEAAQDSISIGNQRSTLAGGGQWVGSTYSTYKRDPFEPMAGGMFGGDDRVRRVVGNVERDERFGYIIPDPVTPDHLRQVAEDRESLHAALGGVDPLGISSGATAFEIKSIYGRTAATAMKKARHLYTYGLCKVFEMAMQAEELAFKKSLAIALNQPLEAFTDQIAIDLVVYGKDKLPKDYRPIGLPPLGDRTISWRWLGPVFEDSPQDILQKSIVVRNLEEIGVETIEALGFLFSEKTRKERQDMLTGYPFREMNASSSALQQQLSVLMNLLQTPNPYSGQPLGLELNNLEVIQRTIDHMIKRLNYGSSNDPADGTAFGFTPAPGGGNALAPSELQQPSPGLPIPGNGGNGSAVLPAVGPNGSSASVPLSASGAAAGFTVPGFGVAGNPAAAGFTGSGVRVPEFAEPIPVPGGTVTRASTTAPGVSDRAAIGLPGIPPDLQSSPGILQQLFPSLFAPAQPDPNARRNRRRNGRK